MTVYPTGPQDSIVYTLTSADGNVAVFNDPDDSDYVGQAKVTGLDDAEIRASVEDRSSADGAIQGDNYQSGRPIVLNVEINASSPTDRNQKFQKMKRASRALREDATLSFTPDGGLASQVSVRKNGPVRRSEDSAGMLGKYQVPLYSADPAIVSETLHTDTGTTGIETITNQGDGDAFPVMTITLTSASTPSIGNLTTGGSVDLTVPAPGTSATLVLTTGELGLADGKFSNPNGLAVDSSGNVYVADESNNRVQKFNSSGVHQWSSGSFGTGDGQFSAPRFVATDGTHVWVADAANVRVQKLLCSTGAYVSKFGSSGTGNGQFGAFSGPAGIALDSGGNIYVCDPGNLRVQKFNSSHVYQAQVGTGGTGNGQFSAPGPHGIASNGTDIWVCDSGNHRVQKFLAAMTYSAQFGSNGSTDGLFSYPWSISIDSGGSIYVADFTTRVQTFNSSGVYQRKFTSPQENPGIALQSGATTPLWLTTPTQNTLNKYTIGTSATYTLDFKNRTVTLDSANAYSTVNVPITHWWSLAPGDNSIFVSGVTSWTIEWRDAWD